MSDKSDEKPVAPAHRPPRFSIRVSGPRVNEARLSANDLAEIVYRTQQALKRIGQVLYGESSIGKGRKKRDIEDLCEVFVVGWKPGSVVAELEMAEPPAQSNLFGHIGGESLKAFLRGMESIQNTSNGTVHETPPGFDSGVLQTCDALGKVLEHGIDTVCFEPRHNTGLPSVAFDRDLRSQVRERLAEPLDQRRVEKVGRLEVLDGHAGLRGRLWEPSGTRWTCVFKPEHLEMLPDVWLRNVKVIGEALVEPNRERLLHVDAVLPLEDEVDGSAASGEGTSFWSSVSLDVLADQQGVLPADDLDNFAALWPVDDDPDELLAHVLAERSARRGVAKESNG